MKKLIDFKELKNQIQVHADDKCGGNFSYAVRQLIASALLAQMERKAEAKT